jgi:acetate kinase
MAYIGNQVTSSPFITDSYTGTGSQTAFLNMTHAPAATSSIAVFVDGVYKTPTTDYTVSGTTLNFVSAPANNAKVVVLHLGVGAQTTTVVADGSVTQAKLSPDIDFGINALFYTGT